MGTIYDVLHLQSTQQGPPVKEVDGMLWDRDMATNAGSVGSTSTSRANGDQDRGTISNIDGQLMGK